MYRNAIAGNPLAKLERTAGKIELMFPLEDQPTYHTHHIIFTVYRTRRGARNDHDKTTAIATIKLPMTQELQVQYNAGYSNPDLSGLGANAITAIERMADGGKKEPGAAATEITPSTVAKFIGSSIGNLASGFVNSALGATGTNAALVVAATFGTARNPHKATLFEGTEFRNHSFSFRFSPTTSPESDAIRNIIHVFKYHMHPGYAEGKLLGIDFGAGNHFFRVPEFFKISLSNQGAYTVNDYQICVLKGMTVNYQPSNYPAYARIGGLFGDPAPMEVIMNLEFQETEIITKEVVGDPYQSDLPIAAEDDYGAAIQAENERRAVGESHSPTGVGA